MDGASGRFMQVAGYALSPLTPRKKPGSRIVSVDVMQDGEYVALDAEAVYTRRHQRLRTRRRRRLTPCWPRRLSIAYDQPDVRWIRSWPITSPPTARSAAELEGRITHQAGGVAPAHVPLDARYVGRSNRSPASANTPLRTSTCRGDSVSRPLLPTLRYDIDM